MKRGKDDEKSTGPMFPRLHVNDTAEKGGPRAPPRNKMALYEQLSIPSQRFGSGVVPLNPQHKPSFVSSASSSQGSGVDRNAVSSHHLSSSKTVRCSEKFPARHPDYGANSPAAQFERKKKVGDEDDFTVPIFVQARVGKSPGKIHNCDDGGGGNVSTISSALSGQPEEQRNTSSVLDVNARQARNQNTESAKSGGQYGNRAVISATNQPAGENGASVKEAEVNSDLDYGGRALTDFSRLREGDDSLNLELDGSGRSDDLIRATRHNPRSVSHCGEDHGQPKELENDNERNSESNRARSSLQFENVDKDDDVSENSMVDSASSLDITPDDVVGVIGQKHFWKARKAIVNQQRVFALQVFELHRLIKVQRLIAGSSHILIEEGIFLGKTSTQDSPIKKAPPEFVTKPPPSAACCKDDSEKPSHEKECSTANTVEKSVLSSAKTGSQPVNYGQYTAQPPPPQQPMVTTNDGKMNPWYFHQPPGGPQWLVPVMSPSEGLVYKPYTGPGVPGAVYGGYGPFSPIPMTSNYTNSAYGLPTHPQAMGVFHGTSPAGHMYFPMYGMPVPNTAVSGSALEQGSHFTGPIAQSQTGPVAGGGVGVHMEQQSSCTAPSQNIEPVSQPKSSKGSDLPQGSTASSRREMRKRVRIDHDAEGKDSLLLFPLAPRAPEEAPRSSFASQPTRAIKVVPHNPRSATESAARIFRFIQEERQQNDAV